MDKLKKAKIVYDAIKTPDELNKIIDETCHCKKKNKRKTYIAIKYSVATLATTFAVFVVLLNVNPSFTKAVAEISILKDMAKIFTFKEYHEETDTDLIDARIPAIANTGNTDLEDRINYEILLKMNNIIAETKERAKEYKKAVLETGGTLEDYKPIIIDLNYEIKYSDENIISFVITKTETLASAYEERYYYNIDIKNGKDLNLKDLLGNDYKKIVDEQVKMQIEERKKDPNNIYFGDKISGFEGIENEYHDFYINEEGKVTISFPKYTIAPGYMGIQEFIIK